MSRPIELGSIPARAGEPRSRDRSGRQTRVYPRACGGTAAAIIAASASSGLSPRVRGNRNSRGDRGGCGGSIPARAGNRIASSDRPQPRRSIPARAGEPPQQAVAGQPDEVYPRACGGTSARSRSRASSAGLSPRVRGNPDHDRARRTTRGSIPARAGEPREAHRGAEHHWVYPRACGGTSWQPQPDGCLRGLSPRVRGNHRRRDVDGNTGGSIPARAGEPIKWASLKGLGWVYPRACGGTVEQPAAGLGAQGLSPRVRGNLSQLAAGWAKHRSIPARAGEPAHLAIPLAELGVYPRACGGTEQFDQRLAFD